MIFDLSTVDTTPGAEHPLSPPASVTDAHAFRQWCRRTFESDPGRRQMLAILARHVSAPGPYFASPRFTGPHAETFRDWLARLHAKLKERAREASQADAA